MELWNILQCFTDDSGILSVFYIGAMGAGDVKLLGVCAGYFSGEKVLCFLFFALLFAAVFALCKMYLARNLWDRLCYLGEYVMLSAVDAGKRILQRREHIREAESVWYWSRVLQCAVIHRRSLLMEQKEAVMVLFDREEEYARLLSEFLRRQKELPWEIHTYTKMEELLEREKNGEVTMLVVAESSCMDTLSTLEPACQAILNESGTLRFHQFPNINKYHIRKLTRCGRNCWNCMWRRWEHNCRFCVQSIRQNL